MAHPPTLPRYHFCQIPLDLLKQKIAALVALPEACCKAALLAVLLPKGPHRHSRAVNQVPLRFLPHVTCALCHNGMAVSRPMHALQAETMRGQWDVTIWV